MSIESFLAASTKPQVLTSDDVGVVGVLDESPAAGGQPAGQLLGVHLVAGAAERHQRDAPSSGILPSLRHRPSGTMETGRGTAVTGPS